MLGTCSNIAAERVPSTKYVAVSDWPLIETFYLSLLIFKVAIEYIQRINTRKKVISRKIRSYKFIWCQGIKSGKDVPPVKRSEAINKSKLGKRWNPVLSSSLKRYTLLKDEHLWCSTCLLKKDQRWEIQLVFLNIPIVVFVFPYHCICALGCLHWKIACKTRGLVR